MASSGAAPLRLARGATLREARLALKAYFQACGVDSPGLSARLLIEQALGADERVHFMQPERLFSDTELEDLLALAQRRGRGEPVAYLTGRKEFFGYDMAVGPGCLIPRPETELLIETALSFFPEGAPLRFVDCGAGSGCISVTLGLEREAAAGLALDRSPEALQWARRNVRRYGLADRVWLARGDFSSIPLRAASCDLVAANPPYVSPKEYTELDSEVKDFEPKAALVPRKAPAGDDGLAALKLLAPEAARVLAPGGLFLCEIGWLQGPRAQEILRFFGGVWDGVAVLADLAGKDRLLRARRMG